MQNFLSPQFANQKQDFFSKQRSPSFRNKRIPSAHQNYLCSSNQNLKTYKQDSPSKYSEEIKRRKSQYIDNSNQLSHSGNKKKQRMASKNEVKNDPNAQNIINSIQILKDEYKQLRQAYKKLINERINNHQELQRLKIENEKLA